MLHTHTPGRSRVNPERQEKGKSRHRRRAKGQNSAGGGKGTNGPPEPTYAAKRTWQKQSTHLNSTTHYGEAQGKKLGTEWGLVGDGRESTKTINLKRTQFQLHQKSCVTPLPDRSQVVPQWHKQLFKFQRIGCTIWSTSPETKVTTPAGKGHACCLLSLMSCFTSKAEAAARKRSFWLFCTAVLR